VTCLHSLGGVGEDELGAKGSQQNSALDGHRSRHRQNEFVALGGSDEGQGDPCVPAGRFHQRRLLDLLIEVLKGMLTLPGVIFPLSSASEIMLYPILCKYESDRAQRKRD